MKKRPYISIIVPSYNQGVFLKRTLGSIEKQSFKDWEVIVLDGGSDDDSIDVIKSFAQSNKGKVRWRSHKDKGQVFAINEGIRKSKGEIIAYINSDDYYTNKCFKTVSDFFSNSDSLWAYGNCNVTQKSLSWTFAYKWLWPVDQYGFLLYLLNMINQPSVFMKKSLVNKVGFFDTKLKLAFDYDYWLRCLKFERPTKLDTILSTFRVHKKSKSSEQFKSQFSEEMKILRKHNVNAMFQIIHFLHNFLIICVYKVLK